MMGGPGVEKSKIEEVATEHDVPLEGIIIKQSAPEASKPMKKRFYESYKDAVEKTEEIIDEFDGDVAVIGVGNTCGVGNTKKTLQVFTTQAATLLGKKIRTARGRRRGFLHGIDGCASKWRRPVTTPRSEKFSALENP